MQTFSDLCVRVSALRKVEAAALAVQDKGRLLRVVRWRSEISRDASSGLRARVRALLPNPVEQAVAERHLLTILDLLDLED